MALSNKKYTTIHSKTGSDKDALKDEFDNGYLSKICDIPSKEPALTALVYQIGLLQEELDYLRTEIAVNKAKTPIATGANTVVSFGDMVFTTVKGKTTHSIVMTVVYTDPSNSKVTTKRTTLNLI
tara:strand:+ start:1779 stop:2153 length:375 start_codon:yes stop_codon:yes gene_type:complete